MHSSGLGSLAALESMTMSRHAKQRQRVPPAAFPCMRVIDPLKTSLNTKDIQFSSELRNNASEAVHLCGAGPGRGAGSLVSFTSPDPAHAGGHISS